MASGSSDFLYEDGFDALTAVINVDMLQNDRQLNLKINSNKIKLLIRILWYGLLISGSLKRHVKKKAAIFQGSGNFIFRMSWIGFSPCSWYETGTTNFKRFLQEKHLQIGSRWMLPWCYLRQGPNERGILVRTGAAFISPSLLLWSMGLTITDSLSLRLRKLV